MRLEHTIVPPSNDIQDYSGVYCAQFEPLDKFIAIGFGDCSIKVSVACVTLLGFSANAEFAHGLLISG